MYGLMMDYQLTIDRIIEHANRMYPTRKIKTKMPDKSMHEYTYADLYRRVKQLGNVLVALGVESGDRVGTFAWNNYQHVEFYFGIPGAGAICHTLNIRLPKDQLAYVINHGEDKVVFVDGTLVPLFEQVVSELTTVECFVLFNAPKNIETKIPNPLFYEDLMAGASDDFEWRSTDEQMAMGMCYTSGTTGNPKGALYSHRSMFLHTIGENQANSLALTEADVVLSVVPQFHAMAWGLPYACAAVGAEIVMPGPFLQPAPLAELIETERVTVAAGVPTIWNGLYHDLKTNPRDISCIRALVVGGSAMPRSLIEVYEKELHVNVLHAWGMTEMSPLGSISKLLSSHQSLSDGQKWDIKAKQGYPVLGVEMRVIDGEGNVAPWDGVTMGELQVRGPWVAREYFKLPASTDSFTEDGWFRTGDVVTMDAEGFMTITDRTKDVIKSGGEWISSVQLEGAIMAHPRVMEACVIAVPDEQWTERPLAVVVLTPDGTGLTSDDLNTMLLQQFPKYWLPDQYVFIKELPKTSVGKFDKKLLRERYAEGMLV